MIITKETTQQIQEMLDYTQRKTKSRILKVDDIFAAVMAAESKLYSLGIPKKHWEGCKIVIEPETVTINYNHTTEGTRATIFYKDLGWDLVRVFRDKSKYDTSRPHTKVHLLLSETAHRNIPFQYIIQED